MPRKTDNHATHQLIYDSLLWRGLFYVSAFILNIVFTRIYQASVTGWVFFAFNYYTLFITVLGFSLESGLGYFAARKEMNITSLIGFSIAYTFLAAMIAAGYFFWHTPAFLHGFSQSFILLTAVAFIGGNLLTAYCTGIFYGRGNFSLPNIVSIGINGVLIVYLLIVDHARKEGAGLAHDHFIRFFFYSFFLQSIIMVLAAAWYYRKQLIITFPAAADLKKLWVYSAQAFIGNFIFFIFYRIDYWFVERYCSAQDLGNYIQVSKLVQLLITLPGITASAVFSLAAGEKQFDIKSLKGLAVFHLLLNVILCAALAVAGQWLFPFVYGESFTKMYAPFLLLMPGIFALTILPPFAAYFAGINRIWVNIKGSCWALTAVVAGDIIFIPRYGIKAAALVSSIGYMVYPLYVMIVFKKKHLLKAGIFFSIRKRDLVWSKQFFIDKVLKRKTPAE